MKYTLYKVPQSLQDAINVSDLISVGQKTKTSAGFVGGTNPVTATELLHGCELSGTPSNYTVKRNGVAIGCMKKGVSVDYIFYNNVDKTKATMIHLLVIGDKNYDLLCINPSFETVKNGNVVTVVDTTEINGTIYGQTQLNRVIRKKGRHFSVTDVDSNVMSLTYLGGNGYNQNGSSTPTVTVSKTEGSDYTFKIEDELDPDNETLNLQFLWNTKNESNVLRIPLNTIFNDL